MTADTTVLAFGVLPANGNGQVALPTTDGYRIVTQEDYQRVLGALAFYGIGSHCNLSPAGVVGYEFARQEFSTEMRLFEDTLTGLRDGTIQPVLRWTEEMHDAVENDRIGD